MFVNVVEFPPVKEGRDAEFRAWFDWSNGIYEGFEGFVARRLLEDTKVPGRYGAIVESARAGVTERGTFMAMHLSDTREEAWQRLEPLLTGSPTPHFYTVVLAAERRASP